MSTRLPLVSNLVWGQVKFFWHPEVSHFMKMRTRVRRSPAPYPYLAPAPRAANVAVCPYGGSSSTLLSPIKTLGRALSTREEARYPTQNLPVRTGARLFNYFKPWVTPSWVGGCFLPIHLEFIVRCAFLLSVWCVNPLSRWSSCTGSLWVFALRWCVCVHHPANRFR